MVGGAAPAAVGKPAANSNILAKAFPPPLQVREVRAAEPTEFPPAPVATSSTDTVKISLPPPPGSGQKSEHTEISKAAAADRPERATSENRRAENLPMPMLMLMLAVGMGVVAVTCVLAVTALRGRIATLSEELQATKFELVKANVSLETIRGLVEELSLESKLHSPDAMDRTGGGAATPKQPEQVSFRPQRTRSAA